MAKDTGVCDTPSASSKRGSAAANTDERGRNDDCGDEHGNPGEAATRSPQTVELTLLSRLSEERLHVRNAIHRFEPRRPSFRLVDGDHHHN
jgi:hypothetical protein